MDFRGHLCARRALKPDPRMVSLTFLRAGPDPARASLEPFEKLLLWVKTVPAKRVNLRPAATPAVNARGSASLPAPSRNGRTPFCRGVMSNEGNG